MLYGVHYFLQGWNTSANLAAIFAMALLMAWLFNPLRMAIQRVVDRMFYGESYDYRRMVLSFAQRMSSVLDLGELAEAMLRPLTKAVGASQASLLLSSDGDFVSQFAERLVEGEPITSMKLGKESPIINWLTKEDKPLSRELIDLAPEFKEALGSGKQEPRCSGNRAALPDKKQRQPDRYSGIEQKAVGWVLLYG